jgi:transposase
MYSTTKARLAQILVWLFWFLALLTLAWAYDLPVGGANITLCLSQAPARSPALDGPGLLSGIVTHDPWQGPLFPWQPRWRWRKLALQRYRAARRAYRRALWAARLARLALTGAITMATVVDWLTHAQLHRHLGALPVLYALLEILQVRQIINRHVPTAAQVDHGTVALVLILNRLSAPRPLYQVADWLAQTVLVYTLGIPAEKFNDDRLGRSLEAIAPYAEAIWQDVVHRALLRFDLDVRFLFYDLTAFVVHGEYAQSELADFGFAHNTPMNKRKIKAGLTTLGDGDIPLDYALWSGRTADTATVQTNMERLSRLLARYGYPIETVLLVGDRANLNDELALAYDAHQIKYLAGLEARKKEHRALLTAYPDAYFYRYPLGEPGYWGVPCPVVFKHQGKQVVHRGLVVLSGPMRRARRRTRATQLRALRRQLQKVQEKIGRPRYRTAKQVQQRAETRCRRSPVGRLMQVWTTEENGQVSLHWAINREALLAEMRKDGRYLLVTNDPNLTPTQMLALYRQKDGVEKRILVCKQDLKVSPIYLHKDERIQGMLLIHMLALLTYSLLERQMRRHGLEMTLRRLITRLEDLTVIETYCWDGSVSRRLTPVDEEQACLLAALAEILSQLRWPRLRPTLSPGQERWLLPAMPPEETPLLLPAA